MAMLVEMSLVGLSMKCDRYCNYPREEKEKIKNALSNRNNAIIRELSKQMKETKKESVF